MTVGGVFQLFEFALYEIHKLIIIYWALLEIYKNPLIYSRIELFPIQNVQDSLI